jgi:tetratricopeptide (TPR) repeat protein
MPWERRHQPVISAVPSNLSRLIMELTLVALNQQGRDLLARNKPSKALGLLSKAQSILQSLHSPDLLHLKSLTSKSLGLAYKATEQWGKSLECFNRALQIEQKANDPKEQAWVHLNIATVCCGRNRHKLALEHNLSACSLLKVLRAHSQNTACMLAVAFHNAADELRHLDDTEMCLATLREGYEVVCPLLGRTHKLTQLLEEPRPVLRRILLPNKPKSLRPAKSRSVQRTRHIYMQDIARHATYIKQSTRTSSRMDEIRRALRPKVEKSNTCQQKQPSPPAKRLFKTSLSESPRSRWVVKDSVAVKLSKIEEKFATVARHLKQLETQNTHLQHLVVSRSSLASEVSV